MQISAFLIREGMDQTWHRGLMRFKTHFSCEQDLIVVFHLFSNYTCKSGLKRLLQFSQSLKKKEKEMKTIIFNPNTQYPVIRHSISNKTVLEVCGVFHFFFF